MSAKRSLNSVIESLEERRLLSAAGFLTSAPAYLTPTALGVTTQPLLTVGDSVQKTGAAAGTTYRMVGIPDGLGAYDNGDGTFTVLMNHELATNRGTVREHGSQGAFISKWVLDKTTGAILSGSDLIKTVHLWDGTQYVPGATAFQRFCSADLPDATAFLNAASGKGTSERIFLNGEENTTGRAFAHVVSTGESFQLPWLGRYAFENVVASPYGQDKTIVAGLDDSARTFASEGANDPSEVYFYIGEKTNSGNAVEKAGLTGGLLYGVKVGSNTNETTIVSGERFSLASLGDVSAKSAATLQTESTAAGITQFRRVEDGHWDPTNRNVMYFVTTDGFGLNTRLWKLTFDDITNPQAGGKIEIAFNSPAGVPGEMFDNMTVNSQGNALLQEDPGNQSYLAKVWEYDAASGDLVQLAQHNADLFTSGLPGFLTQDEESSGIIDLSHILGPGSYLADVQAHYAINAANPRGFANPDELVEGGQLLLIRKGVVSRLAEDGTLNVIGTSGNDVIHVSPAAAGKTNLFVNGQHRGAFAANRIVASGGDGNDVLDASWALSKDVEFYGQNGSDLIRGGIGNDALFGGKGNDAIEGRAGNDNLSGGDDADVIYGGAGHDLVIGGKGADWLLDGEGDDLVVTGYTSHDDNAAALSAIGDEWRSGNAYDLKIANIRNGGGLNGAFTLNPGVSSFDDAAFDFVWGGTGRDYFQAGAGDAVANRAADETRDLLV